MNAIEIIRAFSSRNISCFTKKELANLYPQMNYAYLSQVLSRMVKREMLARTERGKYCIIPLDSSHSGDYPDWRLIAGNLMNSREHYIAYYSAMEIHGLTEVQEKRKIIATPIRMSPSNKTVAGTEFLFTSVSQKWLFGFEDKLLNLKEQYRVSDLEKTIVDITSRPRLSGGMPAVAEAIYRSAKRVDTDKLFYYYSKSGSHASKKRYLYISHLLDLDWSSGHKKMTSFIGSGYSLLDPAGPQKGKMLKRFKLRLNTNIETIVKQIRK